LEGHALADDIVAVAAFQQRLLDAGKSASWKPRNGPPGGRADERLNGTTNAPSATTRDDTRIARAQPAVREFASCSFR
jgi:hypothetical protein